MGVKATFRHEVPIARKPESAPKRSHPRYSTRVIKAGALLPDTKVLLTGWDLDTSVGENLARFRRENPFGKASRSRVEDMLAIFRQRYLRSEDALQALVHLAQHLPHGKTLDKILYFHTSQADPLIRDGVLDFLWPAYASGKVAVSTGALEEKLLLYSREGKTAGEWLEATARRVAQGLLSLLRDFGLLEGAAKKTIAAPYLPVPAFAYIAFHLSRPPAALSGRDLLQADAWRLFLLDHEAVERGFLEAHQEHFLEYQAAGSMVRIVFPSQTLPEYARVVARRAR
jgi:hypothetical protein